MNFDWMTIVANTGITPTIAGRHTDHCAAGDRVDDRFADRIAHLNIA